MFLRSLIIKNFRNYENLRIDFSDKYNIITGNNGTGKTNILEAISVVSNIRSFRNVPDHDMIKWGCTSYHCKVTSCNDRESFFEIGCSVQNGKVYKKARIDGADIPRTSEYIGKFPSVMFSPSDILIISDSPDYRRRYIDGILSRTSASYYNSLITFKHILSSRNKTLKLGKARGRIDIREIQAWDSLFAEHASEIIKRRVDFLYQFEPVFRESYSMISGMDTPPIIKLEGTVDAFDSEYIIKRLSSVFERDSFYGTTTIGPHRDDFVIVSENGARFNNYASQGQKRTAAIALKCAEGIYIDGKIGGKAIVMVDDVFSELDEIRRKNLISLLDRGNQVIFTMVYPERVDFGSMPACTFFKTDGNGAVDVL